VAVSPRATPWLVAVDGTVRTRACRIKSAPDPSRSDHRPPPDSRSPRLASCVAVSTAPSPMAAPRCLPPHRRSNHVGPKSPSPLFGKPRRRAVRRRPHASPHAPAPPSRSKASPSAKLPRCLRPPSCPRPDSRVRRFLPAPPPGSPSLPSKPRCRRVSSPSKVPLPLSVLECSTTVGAVRLDQPRRRDVPSPWTRARRALWALGPALGHNVGRPTSRGLRLAWPWAVRTHHRPAVPVLWNWATADSA
jgi:hypothetical protein